MEREVNERSVTLRRDCHVTQIPSGEKNVLSKGAHVTITQCLGGNFTVATDNGYMFQVSGKDADALGKEIPAEAKIPDPASAPVDKLIWDQLKTCYDPEIPVNMVDLGLIYDMKVSDHENGG